MTVRKTNKSRQPIPDFSPGEDGSAMAKQFLETIAESRVDTNFWRLISCLQSLMLVCGALALVILLPLKSVETIRVLQTTGGRLTSDGEVVGKWKPDQENINYFLNLWASKVFDINAATIDSTTRESSAIAIGTALQQLNELRTRENPYLLLRNSPGMTREYRFTSINMIDNQVALLRFKTLTRANGSVTTVAFSMRITHTLIKPKTIDDVIKNPAGIFITSFNLSKESTQ